MNTEFSKLSDSKKFDRLLRILSDPSFYKNEGLGGEPPFYIYPHGAEAILAVEQMQKNLIAQLTLKGISVLEINLYDTCIGLLKDRGILEQVFQLESQGQKDVLRETLGNVLDPATHIRPLFEQKLSEENPQLIFLTGVAEVYPFLHTEDVLSNLIQLLSKAPLLLFFPGDYSQSLEKGSNLNLFSRIPGNRYYRAIDITRKDFAVI
ncbi:MAG: DUF1788 domain-containing protein [Akkermansiaceae bacterium]